MYGQAGLEISLKKCTSTLGPLFDDGGGSLSPADPELQPIEFLGHPIEIGRCNLLSNNLLEKAKTDMDALSCNPYVSHAKRYTMLAVAGIPRVNYAPAVEFGHLLSQSSDLIKRGWNDVMTINKRIDDVLAKSFRLSMGLQEYFKEDDAQDLERIKDIMVRPFSEGGCSLILPGRYGNAMRLREEIKYAAKQAPAGAGQPGAPPDVRPPRDQWDDLGAYGALLSLAERHKDSKKLNIRDLYHPPSSAGEPERDAQQLQTFRVFRATNELNDEETRVLVQMEFNPDSITGEALPEKCALCNSRMNLGHLLTCNKNREYLMKQHNQIVFNLINAMHSSRKAQATPQRLHQGEQVKYSDGEFTSVSGHKYILDVSVCSNPDEMATRYAEKAKKYKSNIP